MPQEQTLTVVKTAAGSESGQIVVVIACDEREPLHSLEAHQLACQAAAPLVGGVPAIEETEVFAVDEAGNESRSPILPPGGRFHAQYKLRRGVL